MLAPAIASAVGAIRSSEAPPGVLTRIVAIDGAGGSGKSSLARTLADVLGARIVQTDDFASWEDPVDWWPELLDKVLVPLASGETPCTPRPGGEDLKRMKWSSSREGWFS